MRPNTSASPRTCNAYFTFTGTSLWIIQRDGDGIGIVDAHRNHREGEIGRAHV